MKPMIREIRINYILTERKTWEHLADACNKLGWSRKSIVKQTLHGFMARHGSFYAEAGIKDAEARGMTEEDYFRTLRDGSEDDLPRYVNGRPAFGKSPIDDIPRIRSTKNTRHGYNTIGLSQYNYVLLKVARIVDGGPMLQVISRMIVQHFKDSWEKSYLKQIELAEQCRFKYRESDDADTRTDSRESEPSS